MFDYPLESERSFGPPLDLIRYRSLVFICCLLEFRLPYEAELNAVRGSPPILFGLRHSFPQKKEPKDSRGLSARNGFWLLIRIQKIPSRYETVGRLLEAPRHIGARLAVFIVLQLDEIAVGSSDLLSQRFQLFVGYVFERHNILFTR